MSTHHAALLAAYLFGVATGAIAFGADGCRYIADRIERCAFDEHKRLRTNTHRLRADGHVESYSDTITTNGRDPHEQHLRWHPLTPGVAGFYRGTETK